MAVGTTADSNITRTQVISLALGSIGVAEPSNNDTALGVVVLNMLMRHLDAKADWLHAISNTESTLTLIGSQQAYATGGTASLIATNIVRLEYAAVVIGTRRDELIIFDKKQSLRTTLQDDMTSQPIAVHLEVAADRSNQRMLFYPTPSQAYSVVYKYRRPIFDFDLSTDNPDFPQAFALPIVKLLAIELAPHFGVPLPERQLNLAEGIKAFHDAVMGTADRPSYVPLKTEFF